MQDRLNTRGLLRRKNMNLDSCVRALHIAKSGKSEAPKDATSHNYAGHPLASIIPVT